MLRIITTLQDLGYAVRAYVSNAVHFGTPQIRNRLIFVGSKLGPIAEPNFTVQRLTTVGDVLNPLGSFAADSHPELHLTEAQRDIIRRFEELSGIKSPMNLTPRLPSRGVTSSNTSGVTGGTLRLLLNDGETLRRLTNVEVGMLQGFDRQQMELLDSTYSSHAIRRAAGDAMAVPHAAAWANSIRVQLQEWLDLTRQLARILSEGGAFDDLDDAPPPPSPGGDPSRPRPAPPGPADFGRHDAAPASTQPAGCLLYTSDAADE